MKDKEFFDEMYKEIPGAQAYRRRMIVYMCPECHRTVKEPRISPYSVNKICGCTYPVCVNEMVKVMED